MNIFNCTTCNYTSKKEEQMEDHILMIHVRHNIFAKSITLELGKDLGGDIRKVRLTEANK